MREDLWEKQSCLFAATSQATALCCYGAFKPAVCQASSPSKAPWQLPPLKLSAAASTRHSGRGPLLLRGVQACRLPGLKPVKGSAAASAPKTPAAAATRHSVKRSAAASTRHSGHGPLLLRGVQACLLPGLKPVKRSAAASAPKQSAAASTRHSGHGPLLLRGFQVCVCQSSNP